MKIRRLLNLSAIQKKLPELGLNQSKIAEELSVSRETVSKWFKGENQPSPGKLLKLSKLLKLRFDDILNIEYLGQPIVQFRKNGSAKTTDKDREDAISMGNALEKLIPYFSLDIMTKPSVLVNPQNNYIYINEVVSRLKQDMNFVSDKLRVKNIISIFTKYHSVIIPVLWGKNKRHTNALRIYLPESTTTWIYLNLDTNYYDFKFWMAHELGHVLAPDLSGDEAETFADNFAGALLFPKQQTEDLYNKLTRENVDRKKIAMVIDTAKEYVISPLSVYKQLCFYAEQNDIPNISFVDPSYVYKFNFRFISYFPTVTKRVLKTDEPKAEDYINFANRNFYPPFFTILKTYLKDKLLSPVFIQNLLDVSFLDAQNIYHAL